MFTTTTSRPASGILLVVATITLFACGRPAWGEESDAPAKESPEQVYELRIYTAADGKLESLHQRFRDHTLRLFEKHGIKSVGYWTAAEPQQPPRLYYLIAYPDLASRERMLIRGIAADPEFHKAVAESERDGKLTTKIDSVILRPTDYSPLK